MSASTPATVDIVIVNYNTREQTIACLDSVAQHGPAGAAVIVVDNGSVDGSAAAIRAAHPEVAVIEAGANLGFARAVNLGARAGQGDYVMLLNPDTVALPNSLGALLDFAHAHPEYGVFGGRTLRPDGTTDPSSCWGAPSLWSLTSYALGLTTAFAGSPFFDPESLGRWNRDTVREVPIITGCLLLTRRADWTRLGGMDEVFFLYGEDAEFGHRALRHGLRSVVVPDATIIHEVGGSTSSSGVKMSMVMAGKVTLLNRTWTPSRARIGVSLLQAGIALRAGLEVATGRRNRTWGAVWKRRSDWNKGYPLAESRLFSDTASTSERV